MLDSGNTLTTLYSEQCITFWSGCRSHVVSWNSPSAVPWSFPNFAWRSIRILETIQIADKKYRKTTGVTRTRQVLSASTIRSLSYWIPMSRHDPNCDHFPWVLGHASLRRFSSLAYKYTSIFHWALITQHDDTVRLSQSQDSGTLLYFICFKGCIHDSLVYCQFGVSLYFSLSPSDLSGPDTMFLVQTLLFTIDKSGGSTTATKMIAESFIWRSRSSLWCNDSKMLVRVSFDLLLSPTDDGVIATVSNKWQQQAYGNDSSLLASLLERTLRSYKLISCKVIWKICRTYKSAICTTASMICFTSSASGSSCS